MEMLRLATHFSQIDDTVYVRAQQYAVLLSHVQEELSKKQTPSGPLAPLNAQTTKQYVVYIPTKDPTAGAMQLQFDFGKIEYPNADESTSYNQCTFDQPAMGDNSNSPVVSIHSRWYACYVPGIGRDPLNLGAVELENAILLRLHEHLTAILDMETNYQNIVQIEDGVALAKPQTWGPLWEKFVSDAVELNLFANIDKSQASSESECGDTVGSFACVERAWAYEHNREYEPPASKDDESRLPQETTVEKLIARSPSARIL